MSLFVLTINNQSPALEKQHQEAAIIHQYVEQAAKALRSSGGATMSKNILAPGGAVIGSWTYTPQAAS